jgi:Holliday junction resolvase RusA-like endonuclease
MAQPRPRFKPLFKAGKFFRVHVYDPPNSSEWKENFGIRVGRILPSNFPVIGPVELNTLVYKKIPDNYSSAYRYLAEAGLIRPEKKPDADNYIKSIKDALSKIAWSDDSQVVLGECEKFYSAVPRVEFTMRYKERPMDKISLKKGKKEANDE